MSNYKKAAQKTELMLDILIYASKNNLDVHKRGDVKKILTTLGIHYQDQEFDELISLLQDTDTFTDMLATRRNRLDKKLPN